MNKYLVAVAFALASLHSAAATYSVASGPYAGTTNFTAPCGIGFCANFAPGAQLQGTFVTAANFAPNLAVADVTAQVTGYTFSDGLTTYSSTDVRSRLFFVQVSTDAAGNLTGFQLLVQRWQTAAPHGAGDRLDMFDLGGAGGTSSHNAGCNLVGISSGATADTCLNTVTDTRTSSAFHLNGALPVLVPPGGAASIPTLGEWGFLLTALALAASGMLMARRR